MNVLDNPRLSKVLTLDAVVSHLVAISSTTGFTSKAPANDDQKSVSNSSNGTSNSESDFPLATTTTPSDISIIIVSGSPEEKTSGDDVPSTDEESCTELVIKLLDALEIVKECIL